MHVQVRRDKRNQGSLIISLELPFFKGFFFLSVIWQSERATMYINIFITFHSKKKGNKGIIWQGGVGREVRKEEQQLIILGLLSFLWDDGRIATEPKKMCAIFSIWSPESTENILSSRWESKSWHPSSRPDSPTTELLELYDEHGQIHWCPFNFLIHFICFNLSCSKTQYSGLPGGNITLYKDTFRL